MASDSHAATLFVALEPEPSFCSLLRHYKKTTRTLVGDQLFLDDPPHLTVCLSVFSDTARVLDQMARLAGQVRVPCVDVIGWHVFENDALTGRHTLVCNLSADDHHQLRGIQRRCLDRLAPLREKVATEQRYAPRRPMLTPTERDHIKRDGFPYVGQAWLPHFTVASVRSSQWPILWNALSDRPPRAQVRCPHLRVYRLDQERPELVGSYPLSTASTSVPS